MVYLAASQIQENKPKKALQKTYMPMIPKAFYNNDIEIPARNGGWQMLCDPISVTSQSGGHSTVLNHALLTQQHDIIFPLMEIKDYLTGLETNGITLPCRICRVEGAVTMDCQPLQAY